jgi:cytosine/adenosine deaminase-related metal-dependent hydrolase
VAPEWLVRAIIQIESKGNPYAVHVGGKAHYPETKEEALRLIAEAVKTGAGFDIGLMQVNRFWLEKYGIPPESLLDPDMNKKWGTAILADEIARHGLTWTAVGRYHSPDTERGRLYAWKIFAAARTGKNIRIINAEQESRHADQEKSRNDLSDAGGIQRRSGQRQSGRVVTFGFPSDRQPGAAGQKP